jgi:predicted amidohydrolase YtcJ
MQADLVIRGGRVFTALAHRPFCEALAIQDGRIVAVGTDAQVRDLTGPKTRVVDLRGRLALPGFHDAHTHLLGAGLLSDELSLEDARSPQECAARAAERARARPGEWVLGRGWDADRFPGAAWPHRRFLDAVTGETPVFLIRRDGHAAWANGHALELAGIEPTSEDPPHGKILRDEDGQPSGVLLEEPAISLVRRAVPAPSLERRVRAAARGLELARVHGITQLQDDASWDDRLAPAEAYRALLERGELTARVTLWQRLGRPLDELRAERAALPPEHRAPRLAFGLLKGFLDGSLGSRTALLEEPYSDAPDAGCGLPLLEPEQLATLVAEAHAGGFQIGLHAIGDRAIGLALDAFESLRGEDEGARLRAARHRIEHAQVFRPADIRRFGVLGVVASVQPVHLSSDSKIALARLGEERCRSSYPWRSLLDAGSALAFGTDYPVEPIDPLRGIFCAVTRRSPDDPRGPDFYAAQRLTREEALTAYTAGAAFAAHQERILGRIAPGFQGDVAVLSQDLFALPPEAIPETRCDLTVVDGEVVFERR